MMRKKLINWAGRLLMLMSVIFIVLKILKYREDMRIVFGTKELVQMGICSVLYAAVVYGCPLIYRCALLITSNKKINYKKVAYIYCKSNILKYLPGNVMQYVGRNEIALTENILHREAAAATLLEIAVTIISSVIIALVFSGSFAVEWISKFATDKIIWFTVAVLVICVAGVLIVAKHKKKITNYIGNILNKDNIKRFMKAVVISIVIMILNSILYFYVLSILGIQLERKQYGIGIGLYSLSFVLGYITPGVPGGIGVREAVLVYFYSAFISESQILTGSIVFRIISIIGDFTALIIAVIIKKFKNKSGVKE